MGKVKRLKIIVIIHCADPTTGPRVAGSDSAPITYIKLPAEHPKKNKKEPIPTYRSPTISKWIPIMLTIWESEIRKSPVVNVNFLPSLLIRNKAATVPKKSVHPRVNIFQIYFNMLLR